jgi:hypothetical protein
MCTEIAAFAKTPIQRGDKVNVVDFQTNEVKEIELAELLGHGTVTNIFAVKDHPEWAFRASLIKSSDSDHDIIFIDNFRTKFLSGEAELRTAKVPIVKIYGNCENGVLVERLPKGINLRDYLNSGHTISLAKRRKMNDDLIEFAKKTAGFESIGDFRPEQLMYVEDRGWILFDWTRGHVIYNANGDPDANIFKYRFNPQSEYIKGVIGNFNVQRAKNLQERITRAIALERKKRFPLAGVSAQRFWDHLCGTWLKFLRLAHP